MSNPLHDILGPVKARSEELRAERVQLVSMIQGVDEELRTLDRVLKAAGLDQAPKKNGNGGKKYGPSQDTLENALEWIRKQKGEWTREEMAAEVGINSTLSGDVIVKLREMGTVRLVGRAERKEGQLGQTPMLYMAIPEEGD